MVKRPPYRPAMRYPKPQPDTIDATAAAARRKKQLKEEWGRLLAKARQSKGFTVRELGDELGMDPSKVSRVENGKQAITVEDASLWIETCGLRLPLSLAPRRGSPSLGEALAGMDAPHLEAVEALAGAMPHVPDNVREMFVREALIHAARAEADEHGNRDD